MFFLCFIAIIASVSLIKNTVYILMYSDETVKGAVKGLPTKNVTSSNMLYMSNTLYSSINFSKVIAL